MSDPDARLAELRAATDPVAASAELKARLRQLAADAGAQPQSSSRAGAKRVWARRAVATGAAVGMALIGWVGAKAMHAGEAATLVASDESKAVFEVTAVPSHECWGLGPGATQTTADKVQLAFNFPVTAKRAIATLEFTAGSVEKAEEVDITANGVHQAFVNPSLRDDQQAQEVPLTTTFLKPNDKNLIVFDNLENPPHSAPWVICDVAVRVEQLPDGRDPDLLEQAHAEILNADRFYQDRLTGSGNLFAAWKSYRKAELFLLAMNSPPPDELGVITHAIRDMSHELNERCTNLIAQGEVLQKQNRIAEAISQYKYGLRFFPTREHPCFDLLQARLADLE